AWAAVLFLACHATELRSQPADSSGELSSGQTSLRVSSKEGVELQGEAGKFANPLPVSLQLLDAKGATRWLEVGYRSILREGESLRCLGTIETPSGSRFEFADTYATGKIAGTVLLSREVVIKMAAKADAGFLTRFSLSATPAVPLPQQEIFIPGVWYRD